jgi:SAM-dependent methyltransferase
MVRGGARQADSPDLKGRTRDKYDDQWAVQDVDSAARRRKNLSLVADPLLSMAQPFTGRAVADLGIGTGSLAFRAMELSPPGRMVGIDFSYPGLCVSRVIADSARFRGIDFDVVMSQATFNLLPNKSSAMKEIARVTKSGGRVAISDSFRTTKQCSSGSWEECIAGAVTVAEFSTLALDAGLIISGQMDLTKQVKQMIAGGQWDWPDFIEHNMDYRAVLLMRS